MESISSKWGFEIQRDVFTQLMPDQSYLGHFSVSTHAPVQINDQKPELWQSEMDHYVERTQICHTFSNDRLIDLTYDDENIRSNLERKLCRFEDEHRLPELDNWEHVWCTEVLQNKPSATVSKDDPIIINLH